MVQLIIWRLARTGLAIWALASVMFLLSRQDRDLAAQLVLPDASDLRTSPNAAGQQQARLAVQQRLGLNLPLFYVSRDTIQPIGLVQWHWNGLHNQYHRWATGLARGDLGTSFRTGQAVTTRLRNALALTLPLTGTAAVLAVLMALAIAQRLAAGPWWQHIARAILTALHALPLFLVALGLLLVFANPDVLAWFPAYGFGQSPVAALGNWASLLTYLWHLVLPVTALIITALPDLTIQLDSALNQELHTNYATTARAKGLSERSVIRHHALRNALLPSLTQLAELLPALVAGAVVVEVVFALPGMGRLLAEAAAARDYPVLVGGLLLAGAARLLALFLADLFYYWADPRIHWQS